MEKEKAISLTNAASSICWDSYQELNKFKDGMQKEDDPDYIRDRMAYVMDELDRDIKELQELRDQVEELFEEDDEERQYAEEMNEQMMEHLDENGEEI